MKGASIKYALWLGAAFAFVSLAAIFFMDRIDIIALTAFVFGIIVVVGSLSRYNQCNSPEDERMRKIAAFAMMNSWVAGITLMSMLLVMTYFNWGHALSSIQAVSLTIILMLGTFYAWYLYYSFRGDVS
jgi:uncharacterized membrane protein